MVKQTNGNSYFDIQLNVASPWEDFNRKGSIQSVPKEMHIKFQISLWPPWGRGAKNFT